MIIMLAFPSFLAPAQVGVGLLNKLLRRQMWARERLQRHAGKTIRLVLGGWSANLVVQSDGCVQVADPAAVPDVALAVLADKLPSLPGAFSDKDPDRIAALLHIQGDAGLAHTVSDLARNLRWDMEDDLAHVVGDVPAVRIIEGLNAVAGGLRRSAWRLGENISEYLADEAGQLLGRFAFDEWQEQLESAQDRIQRLEQRLAALDSGRPASAAQGRSTPC